MNNTQNIAQKPVGKFDVHVVQVNASQAWLTIECGGLMWEKTIRGTATEAEATKMWRDDPTSFRCTKKPSTQRAKG